MIIYDIIIVIISQQPCNTTSAPPGGVQSLFIRLLHPRGGRRGTWLVLCVKVWLAAGWGTCWFWMVSQSLDYCYCVEERRRGNSWYLNSCWTLLLWILSAIWALRVGAECSNSRGEEPYSLLCWGLWGVKGHDILPAALMMQILLLLSPWQPANFPELWKNENSNLRLFKNLWEPWIMFLVSGVMITWWTWLWDGCVSCGTWPGPCSCSWRAPPAGHPPLPSGWRRRGPQRSTGDSSYLHLDTEERSE